MDMGEMRACVDRFASCWKVKIFNSSTGEFFEIERIEFDSTVGEVWVVTDGKLSKPLPRKRKKK